MSTIIKAPRKPRARETAVIAGCIDLMLDVMEASSEPTVHLPRLRDLLNELRRSLGRKEESDNE